VELGQVKKFHAPPTAVLSFILSSFLQINWIWGAQQVEQWNEATIKAAGGKLILTNG
jgi:hypothetical protein